MTRELKRETHAPFRRAETGRRRPRLTGVCPHSLASRDVAEFVERAEKGEKSFSSLCAISGVSRKTGYKWLRRFRESGVAGLEPRSRQPLRARARRRWRWSS